MAKIIEFTAAELELRDKMAELAHDVWSEWMRYMFSLCGETTDCDIIIPAKRVAHWARQMSTPYEMLGEAEKASDIVIAARYMELVAEPLRISREIQKLDWDVDALRDIPVNHRDMMRDEPIAADADLVNMLHEANAEIARLNDFIKHWMITTSYGPEGEFEAVLGGLEEPPF